MRPDSGLSARRVQEGRLLCCVLVCYVSDNSVINTIDAQQYTFNAYPILYIGVASLSIAVGHSPDISRFHWNRRFICDCWRVGVVVFVAANDHNTWFEFNWFEV